MILVDVGIILITATFMSFITTKLKQPSIIAYIIAGLLIGPYMLGLINDTSVVTSFASLGLAFLLFTAGVELDMRKFGMVSSTAVTGGIVQIVVSFVIGYGIFAYLGYSQLLSSIAGLIVALSSTTLVTKILVERHEINALHGRLGIGILVLQDIVAMIALLLLGMGNGFVNLCLLALIFFVLNRWVMPKLTDYAAHTNQLFLLSLATLFFFVALAYYLELPISIGAFMAGVTLSGLTYSSSVTAELKPLREFFAILFFVSLGMQIDPSTLVEYGPLILILFIGTTVIKPTITALTYLVLGYGTEISSILGLYLGQSSEFSIVLVQTCFENGIVPYPLYTMFITTVVLSMACTPYLIKTKGLIRNLVKRVGVPHLFNKRVAHLRSRSKRRLKDHIVIIGAHRVGFKVAVFLKKNRKNVVVIDHDPEVVYKLRSKGIHYVFGDAGNQEILDLARVDDAQMVIITAADPDTTLSIVEYVKLKNPKAVVIARAHRRSEALRLYKAGADLVVIPEMVSSNETVKYVNTILSEPTSIESMRDEHVKELRRFIE